MKTACSCCGKPCTGHRFKHTIEGYPFPSVQTYRASCAVRAMRESLQAIQERIDGVAAYLASKGAP